MSQSFAQYPEGCRVRIEGVESLSQARPNPAKQVRPQDLVGAERVVVEVDRYGYTWMSWDERGTSADFCLKPGDLSLVAAAPVARAESEVSTSRSWWKDLQQQKVEFAPSTFGLFGAFAVFLLSGVGQRLLEGENSRPNDDSIWFLMPAGAVLLATVLSAAYGLWRRRVQYVVELAACAGLWTVLVSAL